MKIFNGQKWVNVAGDAGFVDNILTIGGDNDKEIRIFDSEGEVIGIMNKNKIEFQQAQFTDVQAVNAITKNYITEYSVASGESITELLSSIPKHIAKNTQINVAKGTYNEDVRFEGFTGHGTLILNLDPGVVINGRIMAYGCNYVQIIGNGAKYNHTLETENAIYVRFTKFFSVDTLKIYGRGITGNAIESKTGVYFTDGSAGRVADCTISNFTATEGVAVRANYCSQVYCVNNIGDGNAIGYQSARASLIGGYGTVPKATTPTQTVYGGFLSGDFTSKGEETVPPSKPTLTKSVTFSPTNFRFWRTVLNKWQNGVYMGEFTANSSGNCSGLFVFDMAAIRSKLKGKTIVSASLTLKRKSSGGYDTTVKPILCTTTSSGSGSAPAVTKTYGELGGFTKGQTRTVKVSNSLITDILSNTNISSLMLHRSDKKFYSIWENMCELNVTYKETTQTLEEPMEKTDGEGFNSDRVDELY